MGQHHFNQTAIQAKQGQLPPKPKKLSKRERERRLYALLARRTGLDLMSAAMGKKRYF